MSESEEETGGAAGAGFGDLGFVDAGVDESVEASVEEAGGVVVDINKRRNATDAKREELRAAFPDIKSRARAMAREVPPDFREVKMMNAGGQMVAQPLLTDTNIMDVFEVLFGGHKAKGRPHFDTFRGMTVGWDGSVVDDDFNLQPLVEALVAFRLPGPTYEKVGKLFKLFARQARMNSLIERMNWVVPEWDGVPRAETLLISLFEPLDTPMNREFGRYFWLSVYNRAMYPGCNASMVLALFGAHGIGKSYMGKLICEEMTGDPGSDTVTLDWSLDFNVFLRAMTGQSVIANVAEMAGFNRAEMTKIKNLTTRTMDIMNYKFERDNQQLRQWVMVMDGNEYKGLQRDETGNRRFYPMFVGQLPFDGRGQVQWKDDFYVDFSTFRADFWQVMAECRAWMKLNGMNGYNKMVGALEKKVKAFSEEEMRNDRGTVRDDDLDTYIIPALRICEVWTIGEHKYRDDDGIGVVGRPVKHTGLYITLDGIRNALNVASNRSIRVIPSHLKGKLTSLGGVPTQIKNARVYLWKDLHTVKDWEDMLESLGGAGGKISKPGPSKGDDGGF